jgi:uncharacterized BrkB/YihY/UPF0761 family membrane protein
MRSIAQDHVLPVAEAAPRRVGRFVADVVRRFRAADGTSHTRALAYQVLLVVLSGFIGLVGLASLLALSEIRGVVQHLAETVSPGPSGTLLKEAAQQGANGGAVAAFVGLGTAWIAGTFAMAQVERSANRITGRDRDRPAAQRYGIAALLAVPVGLLLTLGGLAIGAGGAVVSGFGLEDAARVAWEVARWPIGLALAGAGLLLMLSVAPSVRLGSTRHLLAAAGVSLAIWATFTGLLSLYFALSSSSSRTYGPLLAVVALILWAGVTSLALHLGISTAVELERS